MGWGKYLEDIESRHINDNFNRAKSKPARWTAMAPRTEPDATSPTGSTDQKERTMAKLSEFTTSSARPLPVIILADVSGSMTENNKIGVLNEAVAEMIATFAEEDDSRAEIHVSVITFGQGGAQVHKSLAPAAETEWEPMDASGRTPMGEAFELARAMVEDREIVPSRAYRPTLVLVSDGVPTDAWRGPLDELLKSDRASKAARFAMAIGEDANRETLTAFLDNAEEQLVEAHEAREIRKFFRWVTMSVTARSRSATPNSVVMIEQTDLDDFEF